VTICPPICSPLWNQSTVSLITISARMLNKYGERTQPCRTPFLTRNHYDGVPATLTLASCFLYSLASKSIKCKWYPMSIIVTQSLSWEIESNAFLKSTKHIQRDAKRHASTSNQYSDSEIRHLAYVENVHSSGHSPVSQIASRHTFCASCPVLFRSPALWDLIRTCGFAICDSHNSCRPVAAA